MLYQGQTGLRALLLGGALLLSACDSTPKPGGTTTTPPTVPGAVVPIVSVADATAAQTADDKLKFNVVLSQATTSTVHVTYNTVAGTAVAGTDFYGQTGRTVVFQPGEVVKVVQVQPIANAAATGNKTLTLQLSAPINATLGRATATGTLVYALPQAVISDASAVEGDIGGSSKLRFAVTLDKAAAAAISIAYTTGNGTALAGTDFTAASGSVTFAAGESSQSIEVDVIGNEDVQANRTMNVTLSGASGATLKRAVATGTITDDDHARQINIDDATAYRVDGHLTFKLTLDSASGRSITVNYATLDGTAKAGTDYVATSGTTTFAAGTLEQTIVVNTTGSDGAAGTLSFKLLLTSPVNAVLATGASEAIGTIQSNVPPAADNIDLQVLPDVLTADRCDFFDNHYCLFPWPNDHFTKADSSTATGKRINLNILSMPRNIAGKPIDPTEWNRNDGYSPGQAILVRVPNLNTVKTGAVPLTNIRDSFRDSQPIVVLDADTGERHLIWSELDANLTKFTSCDAIRPVDAVLGIAGDAGLPAAEQIKEVGEQLRAQCKALLPSIELPLFDPGPALIIRPAINFKEGHRYIVALRNLKDGSGNTIAAPPAFKIYRDNHSSLLPQINNRRAHMESLFSKLGSAGIQRSSLYMAWDFTVGSGRSLSERVLKMRDDSLAVLGDTTPGDGNVQGNAPTISKITTRDKVSSTIAREVRGVITVPSYMTLPNGIAGSRLYYPPGSQLPGRNPTTPTQTFDFLCRIPYKAFNLEKNVDPSTATTAVPARAVVYGHGLLGSKSEGSGQVGDMIEENNFVYCSTDWIGMASHDTSITAGELDTTYYDPPFGDVLNVVTILADVSNFPTLADRVQQSMINFTYLGRAMLNANGLCALDAFKVNGQCVLDRRELFFDGNSQGGIIGGALVAISPDIKAGVLGVPGMNYSTLLQRSVDFDMYASLLYTTYPGSLDQQFVLSFMQMLWDRAENNGYAQHLNATTPYANTPPKRVLLTPAYGDHQVSMTTAEVMARTIGAKVHCPAVVGGASSQSGPAVQAGAHPAVTAEAVARPDISFGRRHPDDKPYDYLPCASGDGDAGSVLSVWDSGPLVNADGSANPNGVAPPPVTNTPPRPELGYGADPHEFPRSTPANRAMKSDFLKIGGGYVDHCGGKPCATRNFNPAP
ncbi:MAG: Calx-beta domain-containing protein [Pseudomonadota bacterium]